MAIAGNRFIYMVKQGSISSAWTIWSKSRRNSRISGDAVFGLQKEKRNSYAGPLVLIQTDTVPLFVRTDFKWDIFFRIDERPTSRIDSAGVPAGILTRPAVVPIFRSTSVFNEARVLRNRKAIWQVILAVEGPGHSANVIARLVESAEQGTKTEDHA